MRFSKELLDKAKSAKSAEELIELAKAEGMELSADEAEKAFADLHRSGELADEELDSVAGGCGGRYAPSPDGRVGSEREVVFLYAVGQEVEIYTNPSANSARTQRHRIIDRQIGTDKTIWKELFEAPCNYWPKYYCQNVDNSGEIKWYTQDDIEMP